MIPRIILDTRDCILEFRDTVASLDEVDVEDFVSGLVPMVFDYIAEAKEADNWLSQFGEDVRDVVADKHDDELCARVGQAALDMGYDIHCQLCLAGAYAPSGRLAYRLDFITYDNSLVLVPQTFL